MAVEIERFKAFMITIFTPTFADDANTNAQNLSAKEIVSRLPPDQFKVMMVGEGKPDPRIHERGNTEILRSARRGNTTRWLARVLKSKIDVYFFPREGPLDAVFLLLRHYLRLPIALVTYIVISLDEVPITPALARSIRQADRVLGNSLYVSQTVKDHFGIEAATIYDGVDRQLFHPPALPRAPQTLTVLYAGSFQARKRVDVVIREAAHWPAVNFLLAGRGEEEEACRSLVNKLGCRNVTFAGHLSQRELAEEMRHADLFLFPSVVEGHPQVLGQAAACGLPAIAMEKYRPDYVVQGETGYLVKSDEELSSRLALLLSDQGLRLRMSAAAARHALQFDWDKIAQDWATVFVEAADQRRKRR